MKIRDILTEFARGKGLARYLYSLLRREHNIVSDQDRSPGGAAMWVRMAREGIPVQGWVTFNGNRTPAEFDAAYDNQYNYVEQLKRLGARPVTGQSRHHHMCVSGRLHQSLGIGPGSTQRITGRTYSWKH
jgi:hypothetical protein